jgi:flagellar biosynthetic protein FlhB
MNEEDQSSKTFPPSPQKLLEARKKGEIVRTTELLTWAGYSGLLIAFLWLGENSLQKSGSAFVILIDQASDLSGLFLSGNGASLHLGLLSSIALAFLPIFLVPFIAVGLILFVTRGIVFAPSKIEPKISKISIVKNAQNKFGRNGLFQFVVSFAKLIMYSGVLAAFLYLRLDDMIAALSSEPAFVVSILIEICLSFLLVVVFISFFIGVLDGVWQYHEHIRKNMMSRREVMDETKNMEGDPYLKQERLQRAQSRANNSITSSVPSADVIIVNPTHYAVALKWERLPGKAPVCVAKGVDAVALRIREIAYESGVPVHSDPAAARALHATTELEQEIAVEFFEAVAVAIRFSDKMRAQARNRVI